MNEPTTNTNEIIEADITALVEIKQLPIIVERLSQVKNEIITATNEVLAMDCTEESYKTIKKMLARMNKDYEALETLRKDIKKTIFAPYDAFLETYKENVSDIYLPAKKQITQKVKLVEDTIAVRLRDRLEEYFTELANVNGVSFLRFEDMGIHVSISTAKKKTMEAIEQYVNQVASDMRTIQSLDEDKEEVLYEFLNTTRYDLGKAISIVNTRKKAIEQQTLDGAKREEMLKKQAEAVSKVQAAAEEILQAPQTITPPEIVNMPKTYKATFTVTATIQQLKELKNYLDERNIIYE